MTDEKPLKVLFLYTELAGYIRVCLEALAQSGAEVRVVAYPVNPEAPFRFTSPTSVQYFDRKEFDENKLLSFIRDFNPDLILCSGWIDKAYVRVCRKIRHQTITVLISDNASDGSLRGKISALRARVLYKSAFEKAFVPGMNQAKYAEAMGFSPEDVFTGFYTADVRRFAALSEANISPSTPFPKRFVFAGRYVDFKGVHELWEAFKKLDSPDWELHCFGTGPLYDSREQSSGIVHHGFVQPDEMDNFVRRGGIFVLPSYKEPWGVVVHEFASAGFPLICSDRVGAAEAFLTPGENGCLFPAGNTEALRDAMNRIIQASDDDLKEMARVSLVRAEKYTVEGWIKTLRSMTKVKE